MSSEGGVFGTTQVTTTTTTTTSVEEPGVGGIGYGTSSMGIDVNAMVHLQWVQQLNLRMLLEENMAKLQLLLLLQLLI